jgi:predicted ribosome quality control (RQC) complex YloA/Tae2 family protein
MAIGLDAFGVTFLARELRDLLRGRVIKGVSPGDPRVLNLHLSGKKPATLHFLAEPTLPLMYFEEPGRVESGALHMPRFEDPLRGSTVSDVSQIDLDRIVMITASRNRQVYRLYFELIPPFPNLFLADEKDTILAVLFRAGTRTRKRTLERGKIYTPPATPDKFHPVDLTPEQMEAFGWQDNNEILSKAVLGVSPFLSREVIARGRRTGSLHRAWTEMVERYRRGGVTATVFRVSSAVSKNPPYIGLAWFRPTLENVSKARSAESFNAGAAMLVTEFLRTTTLERQKAALLRNLSRRIRKWEKVRQTAREAGSKREQAAGLRRSGEVIIANLARIKKGASVVRLPDIYSEDQRKIVIPLEPRLTPQANADRFFKMAKKAFRSAEKVEERLIAAHSRLQELSSLQEELQSPGIAGDRIREIGDLLSDAGVAEMEGKPSVDERAQRLGIRPRRYVVTGGWTVLVGKSARENDVLTHKYASPSDLWFHARQAQGSHVVLKKENRKAEVPKQAILEAACIAAYYSKARTSEHVPVSYTEKRYVKKARKGPPGLALMLREKVVFVNPALPST